VGQGATPPKINPAGLHLPAFNIYQAIMESPQKEGQTMTESKKPDMAAYVVRDREDKKANWREIGVAFKHKDSKGFDLLLDAVPVNGRVVLRDIEDKAE